MNLGKDAFLSKGSVSESKSNKCYVSSHCHGGVCEAGMLRGVIETSREILTGLEISKMTDSSHVTSYRNSENMRNCKEVGGGHNSVDASVLEFGAKEPCLVDVNREG